MKRFGIVLAAGVLTAILAYFAIPQVLAATPSTGYHASLPMETPNPLTIFLSNPITAGIFWIGLVFGEFASGMFALKLYSRWKSQDDPEPIHDDGVEIQMLFDAFLKD
ncbi:MAG: hypothetical protein ACXAEF_04370 [Candidatus Thorarchaeota archaeon]|jgi:hypothetical protein